MSLLEGANAVVRFGLELCALVALGYWGFATNNTLTGDLLAGLGAPLAFALAWGTWVAPKAPYRLDDPLRLVLEVVVFAAAATVLVDAGSEVLGSLLAVLVAVEHLQG